MNKDIKYLVERLFVDDILDSDELTLDELNISDNLDYVDLGLPSGTLWSKYNIGSKRIEDTGDYLKWDDATNSIYTLPSYNLFTELRDNCLFEWTNINNVNGLKITGKNGNSIFLPATGILNNTVIPTRVERKNITANYWTSTECKAGNNAYDFGFNITGNNNISNNNKYIYISARPVGNTKLSESLCINENYSENDLIDRALQVSQIYSNSELKKIINNTDFVFMQEQILKDNSYVIGGDFDLTWYKFTVDNTVLGLIAVCPMENMLHEYIEDSEDILYIACVEVSKNAKQILGISDKIKQRKLNNDPYKTILKNIIEFIEDEYGYEYEKIRLSTESDSSKLKNVYEQCGFKVIGRTLWDGFEMEKDI